MKKKKQSVLEKAGNPTYDDVEILVIGAGIMGTSLAQTYTQSGFTVGVVDISDKILAAALQTIDTELAEAQQGGIFSASQVREMRARILVTTSYETACTGKSLRLAIETATEDIEVKKNIFKMLDELCAPGVVLATNTSSLDINILARETRRPDKVVWMHFFYLPHKNRAGEYAGSDTASPESVELASQYMKLAGKLATPILNSRKGGAADIVFCALLLEASRMVDEGYDVPSIEAAAKKAFYIPIGFLSLMDANGIPLAVAAMNSFADSSNPDDPLYRAYDNFFTPPESSIKLVEAYERAADKSMVRWVSEEDRQKGPADMMVVEILKSRFLAVAFMAATEVVEAGVVGMEELEKLCQNALLWPKGPFALMNTMGINEALRIVTERMELSHRKEINFPIPKLLIAQAQKNEPWSLKLSPATFSLEQEGRVARVMISNPEAKNALDSQAFEDISLSFERVNRERDVKVIIFDSAPIKAFISGIQASQFIRNIRRGDFREIRNDVVRWQKVVFHEVTGGGKPKIAVVDGAANGGGAELSLAFALDPDSLVIATDRTSFAFPETGMGIYPVLRGTLTLPQVIFGATGDKDLALALSRFMILSGERVSSPGMIRRLGLADFLVPARKRDEVAGKLAQTVIGNNGKPLSRRDLESLEIEGLETDLSPEEERQLGWIKELFLREDLASALSSFSQGKLDASLSGAQKVFVKRIARRVMQNSPHVVAAALELVTKGFEDFLRGKSLDERAQQEIDIYLVPVFQHFDALEGLTAQVEHRLLKFS